MRGSSWGRDGLDLGPPGPSPRPTWPAFLAVVVLLGVNFVAAKFSNAELAPFWGAGFRFFIATLLLVTWARTRGVAAPTGKAWVTSALFGALAFGANFGLLYVALLDVPAALASIVFATIPLLTFFMALLVRVERFRWSGLAGGLVVLAGIAVVFRQQLEADVPARALWEVFLAAVCAAASGIVVRLGPRTHPVSLNAIAMPVGACILLLASVARHEPVALPVRPATWMALAWLVLSSVFAFVLMVWVIGRWGPGASSYSAVLSPLVTVATAAALIGETPTWTFAAGGAVVILGVFAGTRSKAGTRPAPAAPAAGQGPRPTP